MLAALGLTASPLRAFAPCEMQEQAAHAHAMPEAIPVQHGHAMHAVPQPTEGPAEDAPQSRPCLDLTHCAVMAWTPLATRIPQAVVHVGRLVPEPSSRLSSIGRTIDTPPPKRA